MTIQEKVHNREELLLYIIEIPIVLGEAIFQEDFPFLRNLTVPSSALEVISTNVPSEELGDMTGQLRTLRSC